MVLITLIIPLAVHKATGMLLQAGAYLRMGCQVAVESRMGGEKLRIIRQPWIAVELLGYLRMAVQVAVIESSHRTCAGDAARVIAP